MIDVRLVGSFHVVVPYMLPSSLQHVSETTVEWMVINERWYPVNLLKNIGNESRDVFKNPGVNTPVDNTIITQQSICI